MQGGTVIAATSPYTATFNRQNLSLQQQNSGLVDWLRHHGLTVQEQLVLDPQNAAFPMPVTRNIGGLRFQDVRMVDYPYLIDVRGEGINDESVVTADIPQATFAWASPIVVDEEKQQQREVTELFHSSPQSWLSISTDIMPRYDEGGINPFTAEGDLGSKLLGVVSEGRFDSYFADKQSPLLAEEPPEVDLEATEEETSENAQTVSSVIKRSPESARIILLSSNDFLRDDVIAMAGSATGSDYLNTLQFMANAVDWSLEDTGLLSIRARGHFNRTLPPMERDAQVFWEYLNYFLAALALALIGFVQRQRRRSRQQHYQRLLAVTQ
jgi:ABC-2 type transport system permease protein